MGISDFWSLYGDIVITGVIGLLGTAITAIATYFGTKVKKYMDDNKESKEITKAIEACVGLAERQVPKLSGSEKFQFAAAKAAEWLATKGISVSEAEIEIEIENACNAFIKAATTEEDCIEGQQTTMSVDELLDLIDEDGEVDNVYEENE